MSNEAIESFAMVNNVFRSAEQRDFTALQNLVTLALQDPTQTILKRYLSIISRFLKAPLPRQDFNLGRPPQLEEIRASICLNAIRRLHVSGEQLLPLADALVSTQIADILRWMVYLFDLWAFRPWRFEGQDVKTLPEHLGVNIDPHRSNIMSAIPILLSYMAQHPTMHKKLLDNGDAGWLMAQIFLVGSKRDDMQMVSRAKRAHQRFYGMFNQHDIGTSCFQCLTIHSTAFAEDTIARIRQYSQPSPADNHHNLCVLLFQLTDFTVHPWQGAIIDACLEQIGIMHTLITTFLALVNWLENLQVTDFTTDLQTINVIISTYCIAEVITASIERGGSSLASLVLEYGVLDMVLRLGKVLICRSPVKETNEQIERSADSLIYLLDSIRPFVIYPPVFKRALPFHRKYQDFNIALARDPLKLLKFSEKWRLFHASLESLDARIQEEKEIWTIQVKNARETLQKYTDPYKFCDNLNCPFISSTTTKLGCCTECLSVFYCSPYCQKVGWMNGHRKECKQIVVSIKDGREGFPPVRKSHDTEYLNRSLVPRFQYYRSRLRTCSGPDSSETVYQLNFLVYPVELVKTSAEELQAIEDPSYYSAYEHIDIHGLSGPLALARYPDAKKLTPDHEGFGMMFLLPPSFR